MSENPDRSDALESAAGSDPTANSGRDSSVAAASTIVALNSPGTVDANAAGSADPDTLLAQEHQYFQSEIASELATPSRSKSMPELNGDFVADDTNLYDEDIESKENDGDDGFQYDISNAAAYNDEGETKSDSAMFDGDGNLLPKFENSANGDSHAQRFVEKAESDVHGKTHDDAIQHFDSTEVSGDADTDVEDDSTKFAAAEEDSNADGETYPVFNWDEPGENDGDENEQNDNTEDNGDVTTKIEDDGARLAAEADSNDYAETEGEATTQQLENAEANGDADTDGEDDGTKYPGEEDSGGESDGGFESESRVSLDTHGGTAGDHMRESSRDDDDYDQDDDDLEDDSQEDDRNIGDRGAERAVPASPECVNLISSDEDSEPDGGDDAPDRATTGNV